MPDREGGGRPRGEVERPVDVAQKYDRQSIARDLRNSYRAAYALGDLEKLDAGDRAEVVEDAELREAARQGIIASLRNGNYEEMQSIQDFFKFGLVALRASEGFQDAAREGAVKQIIEFGQFPENAARLKTAFTNLHKKEKESPEILDATARAVKQLVTIGRCDELPKLLFYAPVREESLRVPAIQNWVTHTIRKAFKEGVDEHAEVLQKMFHVEASVYDELVRDAVKVRLENGDVWFGEKLYRTLHPADTSGESLKSASPDILDAAKNGILNKLREGSHEMAVQVANAVGASEYFHSPEARSAGEEGIVTLLHSGVRLGAIRLGKLVGISEEEIQNNPKNREAIWNFVYHSLSTSRSDLPFDNAKDTLKDFPLPDSARTAEQSACVTRELAGRMGISQSARFEDAKRLFNPTKEEIQIAARRGIVEYLKNGSLEHCLNIFHTYHISESVFGESDVQEAAKAGFKKNLEYSDMPRASAIEERCFLSEEVVNKLALDAAAQSLTEENFVGNALEIIDHYRLNINEATYAEHFQKWARVQFERSLAGGRIYQAKRLRNTFALSQEACREAATTRFGILLADGNVEKCVAVVNEMGLPSTLFTAPEFAESAKQGLRRVLGNANVDVAYVIEDLCAMKAKDVQTIANESFAAVLRDGNFSGAKVMNEIYAVDMGGITSSDIPFNVLMQLPRERGFEKLYEQDAWHDGIEMLLKLQARAAKAEHDPWMTDMKPLVELLLECGVIDRANSGDAELMVEYVKAFGMYNLPKMAQLFVELKRGTEFNKLSSESQDQLRTIIGKKVEKMTGEQIINELRRFRREMQGTLLADKIPHGIETEIGTEIFAGLKGETKWGRSDSPTEIVATWRAYEKNNPDNAKVPEGYRERSIAVPLIHRHEVLEQPNVVKEREGKISKLLARKNGENMTELGGHFALLEDAAVELRRGVDREKWWEGRRMLLAKDAAFDGSGVEKAIDERSIALRANNTPEEKITKILGGVRAGYAKKQEQALALQEVIRGLDYPHARESKEGVDAGTVSFMEQVSKCGRGTLVKNTLLTLSMEHIRGVAPEWGARFDAALEPHGGNISGERLVTVHDVYVQYIQEHYLSHDGEEHHTGHTAFSPELIDALTWAYGIPKEMDKHVLSKTREEVEALERGDVAASTETMNVTLVPAQGLLRVYAGDIGDACYTSQHSKLAQGEVPDLHAVLFVTNRGTAKERLQGSVLFVETRTSKGENVLLVRANNPRENLIGQVDANVLVQQTIDQAIATAKERGLDIVAVPLDGASNSSSNRSVVAACYKKKFSGAEKIVLIQEAETMFNGYDNWNAEGTHPSVVVWRR